MAGGIRAVVPAKDTGEAKQRLAGARPPAFRRALALAMVEDVLEALAAVAELDGIVVVTVDPAVVGIAGRYGARVLGEDASSGHTAAVAAAAGVLAREGCAGMLTLPGDVPLVTPAEIGALLAGHGAAPAFSIVPAHDGRGSNAVVCSPPDVVPLAFGDDSFQPHLRAAEGRGLRPRVVELAGIGLDIDRAEDLERFMRRPSRTRTWDLVAGVRATAGLPA
jgi:2-phospho-L-lactate guanylyltransferase